MGTFLERDSTKLLKQFIRLLKDVEVVDVKVKDGRVMGKAVKPDEFNGFLFFVLNLEEGYLFSGVFKDDEALKDMAREMYVPNVWFPFDVIDFYGFKSVSDFYTKPLRDFEKKTPTYTT